MPDNPTHSPSAHTPGPWRIDHEQILDDTGRTVALVGALSASPLPIDWPTSNPTEVDAEAEANARLIAASPNLLDAAKELLEWEPGHGDSEAERDVWQALRRAVAKATGNA